jgi:serine protease Do
MATVLSESITLPPVLEGFKDLLSGELAELAARVRSSVVVVHSQQSGWGSGVIWGEPYGSRGIVVTNDHVVPGPTAEVRFHGGGRYQARVVARSRDLDLAALQLEDPIPSAELHPAVIGDSQTLPVGAVVIAVGNPMGERNSVTLGIVSANGSVRYGRRHHEEEPTAREVVQMAMTIRPGNSGGALTDVAGHVMGIPHVVVGYRQAIAVPSHVVQKFLRDELTA